jgi:hypothetical protein
MNDTYEQLIEYCSLNTRVCPVPNQWNELWKKHKDKRRMGKIILRIKELFL